MSTQAIATPAPAEVLPPEVLARVKHYASKSKATSTVTAYKSRWIHYALWKYRLDRGLDPGWMPDDAFTRGTLPDLMAYTRIDPLGAIQYILDLADRGSSVSTINQTLAAISHYCKLLKQSDPTKDDTLREIVDGIRREKLIAPRKKEPITRADLEKLIAVIPADSLTGLRDRAILLLGWNGAFRRSEIAGLKAEDIRFNGDLKVSLRRSKTDQEGEGQMKVIPPDNDPALCPMRAIRAWMDAADIKSGPLFRHVDKWNHVGDTGLSPQSIALAIKKYARAAGLDWRKMSGHSLRSGFITSAIAAGASGGDVMEITGHKSERVMRGYIQDAGLSGKRAIAAARKGNE